jgi:hypothetical protein
LYPEFNPAISLKALSYLSDVPHLSADVQRDLKGAASRVREVAHVAKQDASLFPDLRAIAKERQIEIEPDL